jgi:hypothetical protein
MDLRECRKGYVGQIGRVSFTRYQAHLSSVKTKSNALESAQRVLENFRSFGKTGNRDQNYKFEHERALCEYRSGVDSHYTARQDNKTTRHDRHQC